MAAGGEVTSDLDGSYARRFLAMEAGFAAARRASNEACPDVFYRFAGRPVRLRVVGQALARHLDRAFLHLRVDTAEETARLRIDLWDEAATGIPRPISAAGRPGPPSVVSPDGRFVGYAHAHAATWIDRQSRQIVGWVASGDRLPPHERGKPLLLLLSLWHTDEDGQLVHGGLVGRDGRGVFFAGRGGAGKSTAALACAEAGFDYLGDDCVALYPGDDGTFVGHSLYTSALLDRGHLASFPDLAAQTFLDEGPSEGKAVILVQNGAAAGLRDGVAIHALALPRITDRSSLPVRPATRVEAFLALAPNSVLPYSEQGPRAVKRLRALVERVPAYWLPLGPDLREIPRRVAELLEDTTRS